MTEKIVNNFSLTIATVNGSGSQTANVTLLRALFKMGIPVSGKNLFPSNIQGLPTWYTIRLSRDGFTARRDEAEVVVTLNPASFARDLASVPPGGAFFYADDIKPPIDRKDIAAYPMPVKALARTADVSPSLREYIANMVYVGVVAHVLGIEMEAVKQALSFHFKGKESPVNSNFGVVQAAADWAKQNLTKSDPYFVEPMDKTSGLIMADGNTAAAIGSVYGGVQFAAWYPITPASSLVETLNVYLPQLRKTKDGKATYAVLQAEDELAAIGMTVGAGWGGLRAMTSTSGPGLSLMAEYAGLAYYSETPIVVWDVQRIGPSTGLPTRTAQGDLTETYFLSHGDKQHVLLLPGSVQECFEFGWKAFDLAERLQTPIFVLSDLDLGMNQWMTQPFEYPDTDMDRGKILWEADLEKSNGVWARYKDVDGDGIPWRTVPGNAHPASAWLGRGTGHDENARYSEDSKTWEANMARLKKKYETARTLIPAPVIETARGAKIGIIAYGSTAPAVDEARVLLEQANGPKTAYLRMRALPCTKDVHEFVKKYERIYIVEANRDGQMKQILSMAMPDQAPKFRSACHSDGLPLTAAWVRDAILEQEK
ncbi:MAG: 2-oxoglutarate ferredoxin oxidoreductase subunit alpha [Anaerolineaceae bacterium]|nr:MAG: 2-oxoglutarate ferredoxin oxidoreductase subunit alpha [Anaerolineaceae bacterium]